MERLPDLLLPLLLLHPPRPERPLANSSGNRDDGCVPKHDRIAVLHLKLQFALAKAGRGYDDEFLEERHDRWMDFGCKKMSSPFEGKIGQLQIIAVLENRTRDIQKN